MNSAAILAAVLLATPAPHGRDAACRVSGSEPAQSASAPEEHPQPPVVDPAKASADAKESEAKTEAETPSGTKAEDPSSQKTPANPPTAGARKRRSRTRKPAPPTAEGEPRKVVVHRGGTSEPITQILPGMSQEEANRQRESAGQLLTATESALKELAGRSLNTSQQEMVAQVRQYVDVARSALKESDTQRAHTLALKAYLLSDDLVKHQ